jgi:hypothetical protein
MKKEKTILGLVEDVILNGKHLVARIDTGATLSSIDLNLAKELKLEEVGRMAIVKSSLGISKRPVIKAKIKLGNQDVEEEFSLANRKKLTYDLLIGQNILKKGNFLIDPNKGEQ